jgi:hypothetical protein
LHSERSEGGGICFLPPPNSRFLAPKPGASE